MTVTIPSILITTVSISFFILFLSHIFKHKHLLYKHGLYSICFLYIIIIARGFLPLDILFLSHTVILHSQPLLFFRNLLFFDFEIIPFIPFNMVFLIIIIWIIGFTIHNYMLFKQYFQTKKSISVLQDITDPEILHIFMTAKERILPGKNISIRLVSADFVPTPAIWA